MDEVEVWRSHIEDIAFTNNNILADQQGYIQFKSILLSPPLLFKYCAYSLCDLEKSLYYWKSKICSLVFLSNYFYFYLNPILYIFKEI